jgi:CPA2 family monovalent cation:H+ antiporter-2
MVVGLEEGKENLSSVNPKRRFQEGDIVWLVGEQESLSSLNSKL